MLLLNIYKNKFQKTLSHFLEVPHFPQGLQEEYQAWWYHIFLLTEDIFMCTKLSTIVPRSLKGKLQGRKHNQNANTIRSPPPFISLHCCRPWMSLASWAIFHVRFLLSTKVLGGTNKVLLLMLSPHSFVWRGFLGWHQSTPEFASPKPSYPEGSHFQHGYKGFSGEKEDPSGLGTPQMKSYWVTKAPQC